MASFLNPETLLMQSRTAPECNQLAIQAKLKSMYIRKAVRVGLSLDAYCARFSVRQTWLTYGLSA